MIDTKLVRESLVAYFRDKTDWRRGVADRFPHDTRNAQCADALAQVSEYLKTLPDGDPLLERFAKMESPFELGVFVAPREWRGPQLEDYAEESISDVEANKCGFGCQIGSPAEFLASWAETVADESFRAETLCFDELYRPEPH